MATCMRVHRVYIGNLFVQTKIMIRQNEFTPSFFHSFLNCWKTTKSMTLKDFSDFQILTSSKPKWSKIFT